MEIRKSIILRHKRTKLFISKSPDNYHTALLRQARWWVDKEQLDVWLQASCYAPEDPDAYEIVRLKLTYETEDKPDGSN